jgi:hypothetical protein
MHPLLGNLSSFSDDELQKKVADLYKRYNQAYRNGPFQILPQLQMVLEDYNAEVARRNAVKMQELQEKLDKTLTKKDDKGSKGIIDIG